MSEVKQFSTDICKESARKALLGAFEQSEQNRYEFVTPEVVLYNIVQQDEFIKYCKDYNFDHAKIVKELADYNDAQDRFLEEEEYHCMVSSQLSIILGELTDQYEHAIKKVEEFKNKEMEPERFKIDSADILAQISHFGDNSMAKHILEKNFGDNFILSIIKLKFLYMGVKLPTPQEEEQAIEKAKILLSDADKLVERLQKLSQEWENEAADVKPESEPEAKPQANKASDMPKKEPWESLVTCLSDRYIGRPLVGREKEMERCIRILCRKEKNNPIFIGEPGVGKTAIVYGLVKLMQKSNVPIWLKNCKVYSMDLAGLVAGTAIHGEFEKRIKMVLNGVMKRNGILYIDEIHNICDANGGNQSINVAEMLKPYLDGDLRVIGSTTYKEYNKSIGHDKAMSRRFGLIDVKEPSIEESISIINGIKGDYEWHHGVRYTDEAIRYAIEQSAALIHDRFLPDKAIDIIDEAGAYRQQNPRLNKKGERMAMRFQKVDADIVKNILTDVCRIDAKALKAQDNTELKDLDKRLSNEIYGQDDAIRQVVRSVMMSKAGLMDPDKPIASLLFVGPTGVGKTEICKVLAKEMGMELVRFDMSEYTEKHTISKLIGTPAGYVGYDEGGLLTEAIRKTPNCVLLLDEIEKAHSDIYNILLQVMDYARLTDNKGNKADFHNVILVMTSNAGAQHAGQASIGFGGGMSKGQAMLTTVKKTFKPEFLNRLTGTVVFHDMDKTMAGRILDKKLRQLSKRLESKHVSITLSPEAHEFLLGKGFSAQYGGREMDRAIQQNLTPLLMNEILFGKLAKGGNVTVKLNGDKLKL